MSADPCRGAESLLQPYLDRALTRGRGRPRSSGHLRECSYCSDRYVFERQPAQRGQELLLRRAGARRASSSGCARRCSDSGVVDVARRARGRGSRPARPAVRGRASRRAPEISPTAAPRDQHRVRAAVAVVGGRTASLARRRRRPCARRARGSRPGPVSEHDERPLRRPGSAASPACSDAAWPASQRSQTTGGRRAGRRAPASCRPARPARRRGRSGPAAASVSSTRSSIGRPSTGCSCLSAAVRAGPRRPPGRLRRSHVLDERVARSAAAASPTGCRCRSVVSSSMARPSDHSSCDRLEQLGHVGQLVAAVGVAGPQRQAERARRVAGWRDHMSVCRHHQVVVDAQPLQRHGALARHERRGQRRRRLAAAARSALPQKIARICSSVAPGAAQHERERSWPSPACRRGRRSRTAICSGEADASSVRRSVVLQTEVS